MAGTSTQLHIHFVFAVKYRRNLIREDFRDELEKYITGIAQNRKHKMLAIYCMPDHAHIFVGKHPNQSESDLVRDIKSNSSAFIRESGWAKEFAWQHGYGAFSHSHSQVQTVINYIRNQPTHHKKESFKKEFIGI
ncbi:MAG: IS200/IS605 family transposase [Bacteroidia bacterium]